MWSTLLFYPVFWFLVQEYRGLFAFCWFFPEGYSVFCVLPRTLVAADGDSSFFVGDFWDLKA